jgi:hypothetical protein
MGEQLVSTKTNGFNGIIQSIYHYFFAPKITVFDFTDREEGTDYSFDSSNQEGQGYLTIQCEKIEPGVHILLCVDNVPQKYEVIEASFYASPEGMCTALLVRIAR